MVTCTTVSIEKIWVSGHVNVDEVFFCGGRTRRYERVGCKSRGGKWDRDFSAEKTCHCAYSVSVSQGYELRSSVSSSGTLKDFVASLQKHGIRTTCTYL